MSNMHRHYDYCGATAAVVTAVEETEVYGPKELCAHKTFESHGVLRLSVVNRKKNITFLNQVNVLYNSL